jgi:hypothetical protein
MLMGREFLFITDSGITPMFHYARITTKDVHLYLWGKHFQSNAHNNYMNLLGLF